MVIGGENAAAGKTIDPGIQPFWKRVGCLLRSPRAPLPPMSSPIESLQGCEEIR